MVEKIVEVILQIKVTEDHADRMPVNMEVADHVVQEINAAKGQYAPEQWQHAVSASLIKVARRLG